MRVLLDERVPKRLGRALFPHEVQTVPGAGWASKKNGEVLALAAERFDVLVTTDQRLSYQQTVARHEIAVVILIARRNKLEFLLPLVPALLLVLEEIAPGEVRRLGHSSA